MEATWWLLHAQSEPEELALPFHDTASQLDFVRGRNKKYKKTYDRYKKRLQFISGWKLFCCNQFMIKNKFWYLIIFIILPIIPGAE